jgi:vacuolar-type H+-ATPase subunit I/STV1
MKKIQADWKKIGHVPRRDSDKIWKEFKEACNFYFDRVHAQKNEANKEELANFEEKTKLLESLDNLKLSGDHKSDLATIKNQIKNWKALGRVPYNKKSIEQKFNKKLDSLFGQLDIAKKEVELIKYDNKLNSIAYQEDERKLRNEHFFIRKKIDETKAEINQLENNLGFFQHVDDDNPLVKEVHNNIQKHKEQLEVWKAKLKKIKAL